MMQRGVRRLSRSLCKVLTRAQELWIYMSCNDVVVVADLLARLTRFGESP